VIEQYYPTVQGKADQYALFYAVKRVAEMTAQWMAAGFCHGVLNTDNMSITGESFDYGPYAFIPMTDNLLPPILTISDAIVTVDNRLFVS